MNGTIILHTETKEQEDAIKAFAKAMKIPFEVAKESPYDPEFVSKVKKSRQEYKDGNFVTVEKREIKSFLGIE